MAYTPNTWVDRVGVGLNRFTDQDGKQYEFTPNPVSITQIGTPFSAAWMNHIEQGIADADAVTSKVGTVLWEGTWSSGEITVAGISDYMAFLFVGAVGSAIMTETGTGNGIFRGIGGASALSGVPAFVTYSVSVSGNTITYGNGFIVSFNSGSFITQDGYGILKIIGLF